MYEIPRTDDALNTNSRKETGHSDKSSGPCDGEGRLGCGCGRRKQPVRCLSVTSRRAPTPPRLLDCEWVTQYYPGFPLPWLGLKGRALVGVYQPRTEARTEAPAVMCTMYEVLGIHSSGTMSFGSASLLIRDLWALWHPSSQSPGLPPMYGYPCPRALIEKLPSLPGLMPLALSSSSRAQHFYCSVLSLILVYSRRTCASYRCPCCCHHDCCVPLATLYPKDPRPDRIISLAFTPPRWPSEFHLQPPRTGAAGLTSNPLAPNMA